MRVGILGIGYIGTVIACELSARGCEVIAYDNDSGKISDLRKGICNIPELGLQELLDNQIQNDSIKFVNDLKLIEKSEVIIVTVGTPLNNGQADLSALESLFKELTYLELRDKLIMIKSTVPPGTTMKLSQLFDSECNNCFAFSPERLAEGSALSDFSNLPIIVGGIDSKSTLKSANFWQDLGFKVHPVANSQIAELVKLADNAWIDLNIAFAHELAQLSDSLDADVLEVINAANTLKKGSSYVNILMPSVGVGGYCLTKDPLFLAEFSQSLGLNLRLSKIAREINDMSPQYLLDKINRKQIFTSESRILILGLAFKSNTGDIRFSPALQFAELLRQSNQIFEWYDPLVNPNELPEFYSRNRLTSLENRENVYDVIIILASHHKSTDLNASGAIKILKKGGCFIDGRRFLSREEINILTISDIKYLGVGR